MHAVILALAWVAGCALKQVPVRAAFFIVGSQKTEAMGITILSLIFSKTKSDLGVLALPVIMYHSVQMLAMSLGVPFLRAWTSAHCSGQKSGAGAPLLLKSNA